MPFCEKCGNQISESAVFCTACGNKRNVGGAQPTQQANVNNTYQQQPPQNYGYNGYQQPPQQNYGYNPYMQPLNPWALLNNLTRKIKTEAIIWIVIASIQATIGLGYLIYAIECYDDVSPWITAITLLAVAGLNFFTCKKDFDYIKEIQKCPMEIVEKYRPIGGYVSNLVYNIIFGGVIGVVGSIFGFITRSYVLNNEQGFKELEKQHVGNTSVKFGNQWECPNCRKINSYNIKTCVCGQQKPE